MSTIPKIIADFETQLSTSIAVGGTTFSISSIIDDDGNTIPDGVYCFTIDNGSSTKEYLYGTVVAGVVTSAQSISRQGVVSNGAARPHRVGASCIITDFLAIGRIANLLSGTEQFSAANVIGYDGAPVSLTGNNFATVAYVLSVVTGGTVTFDQQVIANQIAGESLAVNDHVYFNISDQKWHKVSAQTVSTFADARRGFCKSVAISGGTIAVAISGPVSGFTGLTVGSKYYASNTSGAISTTPGSYQIFVGWPLSSTQMLLGTTTHSDSFIGGEVGDVCAYAGLTAPTGKLNCDGTALNIASYIPLCSVIHGIYGLGTGTVFTATVSGSLITSTSHGLSNGQPLELTSTSVLPSGLSPNTIYYVISATTNTFQLSATPGGSAIAFTDTGSGTLDWFTQFKLPNIQGSTIIGAGTKTNVLNFDATVGGVNVGTDIITVPSNSILQTGQALTLAAVGAGTLPTGLTAGTVYIIRTDSTHIQLASTLANAQNAVAINITVVGTGTASLTQTLTTRSVGDVLGEETHAMSMTELLLHHHGWGASGGATGSQSGSSATSDGHLNTTDTGGNAAMNNMQPSLVMLWVIKT